MTTNGSRYYRLYDCWTICASRPCSCSRQRLSTNRLSDFRHMTPEVFTRKTRHILRGPLV